MAVLLEVDRILFVMAEVPKRPEKALPEEEEQTTKVI